MNFHLIVGSRLCTFTFRNYLILQTTFSRDNVFLRFVMALTLARKLSEFGETIDDELPLDTEAPYAFQFNGNTNREKSWKQSMLMKGKELNYNSRKTLDYLRDFFGLPEGLPEQHGLGCGAAPAEFLALEAQVLGYEDTLVVIERGDMAVFAPCLADAVPEVFARFLRDAPRFQGHERIYRDGIKRNGVFLPVHAPRTSLSGFVVAAYMAEPVPVAVSCEVVAVPVAAVPLALRARLVMGECAVFIGGPLTAFVVFSVVHGVLFPLPPRMPACS